ncbi:MFS transporter [Paracraurococcus ruber]|uniref:MFS transporter n=1 Tax=Paracraurococcus ruber TaxID=77675 RepID=UPI0013054069|nr:MFS transporter [Paracraurococcus ruber]
MTPAPWIAPLAATLLMQSVASGMGQLLPVLAPLLTADAGIPPESIGPLNATGAIGTILFLLFGGAILARLGPVRALQAGTAVAALGLLLAGFGTLPALLGAALLLGIGYGPTPPAGSRILAATAPARHRSLIFSIKQAGAPAGGVLAGLLAAPAAAAFGWPATLALAVALALLCALAIQPLRAALDVERDGARGVSPRALLARANLAAPFAALRVDPLLLPLTVLGLGFAVAQGCLFAFCVTWLVEAHGMGLVAAGSVFAAMQGAGIVARIALGWLADRTGRAARNLVVQAFAAAGMLALLGLLPAGTPAWVLTAVAVGNGFLAASWNGIVMAEVARLAPPARIQDATSGSTLVVFCGYVLGPALFGALVPLLGGWGFPFLVVAVQLAVGGGLMIRRI